MFYINFNPKVTERSVVFSILLLLSWILFNTTINVLLPYFFSIDNLHFLDLVSMSVTTLFFLIFLYGFRIVKNTRSLVKYKFIKETLFFFLLFAVFMILYELVLNYFLIDKNPNSTPNYSLYYTPLILIFAVSDEIIFRGLLQNSLKGRVGVGFSILITSIIYLIVRFSIVYGIYHLVCSILLGIVYYRTKKLMYPILLNFLINFTLFNC